MKKMKYLFVILAIVLTIVTAGTQTSNAGCNIDSPCAAGEPDVATSDRCYLSSSDCSCNAREPMMCRKSYGPCIGHYVIWEKWRCDAVSCACENGGTWEW